MGSRTFGFDFPLFTALFSGFVFFTVVGTLSHEMGHYLAAEHFGYDASINYRSTNYNWRYTREIKDSLYEKCQSENLNPDCAACYHLRNILSSEQKHAILISAAGPLQTMVTGTIGLLFLFLFRKKYTGANQLKPWQWVPVFFSLFWLRQLFNGIMVLVKAGSTSLPLTGDEVFLSMCLELPPLAVNSITGLFSLFVFFIVFFRFVPPFQRFTFLSAGVSGSLLGYYLWFEKAGPFIMP